ncbi:TPR-like protein [Ramicandelaber brevisporus]|nr:TPR-like protein [Ramicandelaber brevisporus]
MASRSAFATILRAVQAGDDAAVVTACDAVLATVPNDVDVLQAKAIALMRLDRPHKALDVLKAIPNSDQKMWFERAYCLYAAEKYALALKALNGAKGSSSTDVETQQRVGALRGQILYKMDDYNGAAKVYRELLNGLSTDDLRYNECLTNLYAAVAAATMAGQVLDAEIKQFVASANTGTYELAYNSACAALASGSTNAAESLLKEADTICRSTVTAEEGYTADDLASELATITLQRGCARHLAGDAKTATELYQELVDGNRPKSSSVPGAVAAVAANNLAVLRMTARHRRVHVRHVAVPKSRSIKGKQPQLEPTMSQDEWADMFEATTSMKLATDSHIRGRLISAQRHAIAANSVASRFYSRSAADTRSAIKDPLRHNPQNDRLLLIRAASFLRDNDITRAISELRTATESHPRSVLLQLALAQILIMTGNIDEATSKLTALRAFIETDSALSTHSPTVTAVLAWIQSRSGETASVPVATVVDANVQSLRQAALLQLRAGNTTTASTLAEQAVALDRTNADSLALFAATAVATCDPRALDVAESLASALPSFTPSDLDKPALDKLEQTLFAGSRSQRTVQRRGHAAGPSKTKRSAASTAAAAIKSKRLRTAKFAVAEGGEAITVKTRGKLPKGYDPANLKPVDTERWLPLRERSYFKSMKTGQVRSKRERKLEKERQKRAAARGASQGVALAGGGIGVTGSARIAGAASPAVATTADTTSPSPPATSAVASPPGASTSSSSSKKKNKKK